MQGLRFSVRHHLVSVLLLALGLVSASCEHAPLAPKDGAVVPTITDTRVDGNVHNVLSAVVTAHVANATSVWVEYGADSLLADTTPAIQVADTLVRVPILGLSQETRYLLRAVAVSSTGNETRSPAMAFRTSTLPDDIPKMAVVTDQSPEQGPVMLGFPNAGTASEFYALMIDNAGDVVWYRAFSSPVVDFQKQENGLYTVFSSVDGAPPHFYELDALGKVRREFQAVRGTSTDPHEIKIVEGGYCLLAAERREMDLSGIGGQSKATVTGTNIEYARPDGALFTWSPFDHFQVTDAAPDIALDRQRVDPWHGNAIDIEPDGDLLVSFRNIDEITRIDPGTGEVVWRFGGKNNEFTIRNDPLNGFSHQHAVRRLPNGNILLFDNGTSHSPPESRAVEYRLDEHTRVAELVWQYRHSPPLYGFALGSAQRLTNGNTLINYGTAQRVIEVDANGITRWELSFTEPRTFPYRAFRIESLY